MLKMNRKIVTIEDVRRINEQMIRGEKTKLPKEDELFLKKVYDVIGNINSDKINKYFKNALDNDKIENS